MLRDQTRFFPLLRLPEEAEQVADLRGHFVLAGGVAPDLFLQKPSRMRSAELSLLVIQVRLCLSHRFVGRGGFADVRPPSVSDVCVATGLIPFDFITFAFARFYTPNDCCCHKLSPLDAFPGASARVVSVADIAAALCSLLNQNVANAARRFGGFFTRPQPLPRSGTSRGFLRPLRPRWWRSAGSLPAKAVGKRAGL